MVTGTSVLPVTLMELISISAEISFASIWSITLLGATIVTLKDFVVTVAFLEASKFFTLKLLMSMVLVAKSDKSNSTVAVVTLLRFLTPSA